MKEEKKILIQGALEEELEYFLSVLENKQYEKIAGYEFYVGTIGNQKVVLSKTLVGTINATTATTIGILNFHPSIVINQGIAGSHSTSLHVGDIVIGEFCALIHAYKMPVKKKKEGSNSLDWLPNKRAKEIKKGDENLVKIVKENLETTRNVEIGILGSGDVFNREYDRIHWLQETFHNLSEDMESIGMYSVCNSFSIPCIGIRIISNNELLEEKMDKAVALELQKILLPIVELL